MKLVPVTLLVLTTSIGGCQAWITPIEPANQAVVADSVTRPTLTSEPVTSPLSGVPLASPPAPVVSIDPASLLPLRYFFIESDYFIGGPSELVCFRSQLDVDTFLPKRARADYHNWGRSYELPKIDFSKEMGILVIARPAGVTSHVEVVSIEEQPGRLYVRATQWLGNGDLSSQPCQYVAIPRSDKPVVFAPLSRDRYGEGTYALYPREEDWSVPLANPFKQP
ncbi:hypothetical protein D3C72_1071080 [compost metagenome]